VRASAGLETLSSVEVRAPASLETLSSVEVRAPASLETLSSVEVRAPASLETCGKVTNMRYVAHPDVAWVEGPERVAIIDLRDPATATPQLCPEPAASLWRAVAEGAKGEAELLAVASGLVGEQGEGLVVAFLESFGAAGLVVEAR
jgi:hypothetical protein